MHINHHDPKPVLFPQNIKMPLRHIPSAHEFKNEKLSNDRNFTISPRLMAQKENTLLDVASLWEQKSHKPKLTDKINKINQHEYDNHHQVQVQKVVRRESRSRSPTTIPKVISKPAKVLKTNQDFHCDQIMTNKPTNNRHHPRQQTAIRDVTVTVKPAFLHKNLSSWENQIAQFEAIQNQINCEAEAQQIVYLTNREHSYNIDPWYLKKQQKLDWQARAILLEWMMQVHTQFLLKRQTFHLSVNLVDLYLSKTNASVPRKNLQAIGSVCMYVASKMEQQQAVSITKISKCSMDKYPSQTLLSIQQGIIKILGWTLNPPTIDMWANRVMQQWDLFVESPIFTHIFPTLRGMKHVYFKKYDTDNYETSYKNYREMMQLIDCSVVDIQTLQYKPRLLVCSFLYLILGKSYAGFKPRKISQQFAYSSLYLLDSELPLNAIYSKFLQFTFGLLLFDLLPTIQYCSTFFILQISYDVPHIDIDSQGMNSQEYVTYQTYNPYTMHAIKHKKRDIAQ